MLGVVSVVALEHIVLADRDNVVREGVAGVRDVLDEAVGVNTVCKSASRCEAKVECCDG